MEKTRAIISANTGKHSHFEEYFKIIEIIEEHAPINPDVCIESCKALIEGISKTILINLDNTKTTDNIDKDDLPKLFKDTMRKLSDECEDLEGDFAARFSVIIQVIGEIRNKRSDISHGRMAPKFIFSSSKLASTVVNMTDSMLEYILEHYFSINFSKDGTLDYDSKELEEYNIWLDQIVDFPIKKAKYSRLLYENDYDEYESRYHDEFNTNNEIDEHIKIYIANLIDTLRINAQTMAKSKKEEINDLQSKKESEDTESKVLVEVKNSTIESLVNDFYEDLFWSDEKIAELILFASKEGFDWKKIKEILSAYLFSKKAPLRDSVIDSLLNKPSLKERATIGDQAIQRIINFANDLKNPDSKT